MNRHLISEILPRNAVRLSAGAFAGEPMTEAEELAALSSGIINNAGFQVDPSGVMRPTGSSTSTLNSPEGNSTTVSAGTFAGEPMTEAEELAALSSGIINNAGFQVDPSGIMRPTGSSTSTLNSPEGNSTTVSAGTFAAEGDAPACNGGVQLFNLPRTEQAPAAPVSTLGITDSSTIVVGGGSEAHSMLDELNSVSATDSFPVSADDIILPEPPVEAFGIDEDGVMRPTIPAASTLNSPEGNSTVVSAGTFAAQQWYETNPNLFKAEVALMQQRFPQAKYRILSSSGYMVWVVTVNVTQSSLSKPWTFILRYEPDHPHNRTFGGSIKVMLQSPTKEELFERAKKFGRPGVPHLLRGHTVDGQEFTYLCTRTTDTVGDGKEAITTAAQVTAWAVDWAIHFETGIRNKEVWNKWCNDAHFRHLMIK